MERFAAGSTAGAIAQTAIYPMEVELIFLFQCLHNICYREVLSSVLMYRSVLQIA